jgi:hypothetical protein
MQEARPKEAKELKQKKAEDALRLQRQESAMKVAAERDAKARWM